jgi:hypothetical protein
VFNNAHFANSADWSLGTNMTITSGSVVGVDLSTPTNSELRQNDIFEIGATYQIGYSGSVDTGSYGMQNTAGSVPNERKLKPTTTSVLFTYVADVTYFSAKRDDDVDNLIFNNPSAKRFLEAP